MARAWTHLTPVVSLVVALSAATGGQEKPAAPVPLVTDPVREVLEKKGYVAVPLVQDEEGRGFSVECRSGTETFLLEIDTGAVNSSLDLGLVKKLGLKRGGEVKSVGIDGTREGFEVSLRGLSIGEFDTRATVSRLSIRASDFTALNRSRDKHKQPRIGGLLGHEPLNFCAAVIEYPARTLYLRTPLDGLWPEIEGKWVATSGQDDGRERMIDSNAPPTLEFKDRQFHLIDGGKRYAYGLHVKPRENGGYKLVFFDPGHEFAEELDYRAVGLLKVAGDKLTVCLCLDLTKAKGYPEDFTAPAGSGHLLLEFRREKPPAGRPAGPTDPLRTVLEKKGYVAVPLAQDTPGLFTVACKSGTEAFRLVLDTGAEVTALDTGLVKKLGLTPKREVTANGVGSTVGAVEVSLRGLSIGDFDTRATANSFTVAGADFSAVNTALRQQKLPQIDGLLGHSDLRVYAAVIDYSTRTLYLRRPLDGLWPEVEGKWAAISARDDGQERKIDPSTPPRLEFKDRLFRLAYGGKQHEYGLHVRPEGKGRYTLVFFDLIQEFATTLDYKAGGLLTVAGDKLTLCLALDPTTAKGKLPEDFKAPAGSGHVLLEFRREK